MGRAVSLLCPVCLHLRIELGYGTISRQSRLAAQGRNWYRNIGGVEYVGDCRVRVCGSEMVSVEYRPVKSLGTVLFAISLRWLARGTRRKTSVSADWGENVTRNQALAV